MVVSHDLPTTVDKSIHLSFRLVRFRRNRFEHHIQNDFVELTQLLVVLTHNGHRVLDWNILQDLIYSLHILIDSECLKKKSENITFSNLLSFGNLYKSAIFVKNGSIASTIFLILAFLNVDSVGFDFMSVTSLIWLQFLEVALSN